MAGISGRSGPPGGARISAAMRVLAEIIASDVSLSVTFNHAIDRVIQNNPKARANPKALAQLDGYKRPLVSSLSANLQRFGMDRISKVEMLQEISTRPPVSRILSVAVKMLKREMSGIRLLVSYADSNQGHEGKIYQASNWIFVVMTGHEAGIMQAKP